MTIQKGHLAFHYLFNSGFIVETENHFMIFDYYKECPLITEDSLPKKNISVFVSHDHDDHFDPIIYEWAKKNTIQYVLHEDVPNPRTPNILTVVPDAHYTLDNMTIETLGSTDRGVAYLIHVDGLTIFHSGDLNWWHWKEKSKEVHQQEEADYKREIHKLGDKKVDIAFVPADPRLEEYYDLGIKYFAQSVDVKIIVPMHFRNSLGPIQKLAHGWQNSSFFPQFIEITQKNQSFYFNTEKTPS